MDTKPKTENEVKREYYQGELEKVYFSIAEAELSIAVLSKMDEKRTIKSEQVGQFGETKGFHNITAGEALKNSKEHLKEALVSKEAITKLIKDLK